MISLPKYVKKLQVSWFHFLNVIWFNLKYLFLDGSKDLFEQCVQSVKAFLAGEPFQEFEGSMYFFRWVFVCT